MRVRAAIGLQESSPGPLVLSFPRFVDDVLFLHFLRATRVCFLARKARALLGMRTPLQ